MTVEIKQKSSELDKIVAELKTGCERQIKNMEAMRLKGMQKAKQTLKTWKSCDSK